MRRHCFSLSFVEAVSSDRSNASASLWFVCLPFDLQSGLGAPISCGIDPAFGICPDPLVPSLGIDEIRREAVLL